jgi:hypothetical protein
MTEVAVDVVVNNHNYARFLPAAITSALEQTHEHVRVIVVDDGSTDGSRDVIRAYGDQVIALYTPNRGQAAALNAGFAKSAGDVVMFLDADDVLLPHAAATVAEMFAAHGDLAKVQYPMVIIDAAGRRTGARKPPLGTAMPSGNVVNEELTFPFDLCWVATSGNAFARWVLDEILPVPEDEYRLCADTYLVHLAALLGPVASLGEPGAGFRVHNGNHYEPAKPSLDLDHVRQSVHYASATRRHLTDVASLRGLLLQPEILSVADLANRMISLKIDRRAHPIASDSVVALCVAGARASARRWDVRWPVKAMFVAWFMAMAVAPRRLERPLAETFLFPERRRRVNRVVGTLQRRSCPRQRRGDV